MLGNHLGGGLVEQSDNDVSLLSVSVCLIRYLGGGPVERSDSCVCLSVCLCVHDTLFRCVCLFEVTGNDF